MASDPIDAKTPSFEVRLTADVEPGERLLVGTAGPAVAGLTAVDYLVTHVETIQIGHVRTRNLPDLTPFSDGRPRHPIRLYSTRDSDVTVLISEVFLPVWVADPLADSLVEWATGAGISEITVLHGAPFPHNEAEHVVFHVATDEYRSRHFPESAGPDDGVDGAGASDRGSAGIDRSMPDDSGAGPTPGVGTIPPLSGGFFDGVIGELIVRSMDGEAPPTGVLVTPTHLPDPDLDAAIRLLGSVEDVYGIAVDETDLQSRASEVREYYQELADHVQALQEGGGSQAGTEYPSDRMFM